MLGLNQDWRRWLDDAALPRGGADLLPLLGQRLAALDPSSRSARISGAMLVEERRVGAIATILDQAMTRLREGGIARSLVADGPISERLCPALRLRHSGRLALLMPPGAGGRAAGLLEEGGFAMRSKPGPHRQIIVLRHASGLPIELWDGSLAPPFTAIDHARLALAASEDGALAGADRLAVMLAGAMRMGAATDLRWIADVHLLIAGGGIDEAAWHRRMKAGTTAYLLADALAVAVEAAPTPRAAALATDLAAPALRDRLRHARALRGGRAVLRAFLGS